VSLILDALRRKSARDGGEVDRSPRADAVLAPCGDALVAPPAHEIAALLRLAQLGNMRSIRRQADHLAALDAAYGPFAQRLRQLAEGYQSKAILEWVRSVQSQQSPG